MRPVQLRPARVEAVFGPALTWSEGMGNQVDYPRATVANISRTCFVVCGWVVHTYLISFPTESVKHFLEQRVPLYC